MCVQGRVCFVSVATGKPENVDITEPLRVAQSIQAMGLKHAVITSVDRDDLADGGSTIWAATVRAIRKHAPGVTLETLIPDFQGKWDNLQRIIDVKPEVVSHNLETVKRLTREVRIQAKYERSLEVLDRLKKGGIDRTKSGIMLGLGETSCRAGVSIMVSSSLGTALVGGRNLVPIPAAGITAVRARICSL